MMSKSNSYLKPLSQLIEHEWKRHSVLKKKRELLNNVFSGISSVADIHFCVEWFESFVRLQGNKRSQTSMDLLPDASQGNTGVPRKHKTATAELPTNILSISFWSTMQHWRPLFDSISNMLIEPPKLDIINISSVTTTLWYCTLAC